MRPRFVIAGAIGFGLAILAWMIYLASAAPTARHFSVHVAGWRSQQPRIRVVLISDLHVSTPGDTPSRLIETVSRINALHPDVVLIAGDIIATKIIGAHMYTPSEAIKPLTKLQSRSGIFAILGNHDYDFKDAIARDLAIARIRLLNNEAVRIGPIALIGVSDDFSHHANVATAVASWRHIGGQPVVFTHSPDVIPDLPASMRLVLAGHTHCGQIRLPLIGSPITHSRFGQHYACGIVKDGSRISIITAGLGISSYPLRLAAPPDFWVIDFAPALKSKN
jgi:predicted MPP superfamily phosphohydrolase